MGDAREGEEVRFIIERAPIEVRTVALVREGNNVALLVDGIKLLKLDASFMEARLYSDATKQCGLTAVLVK